MINNKLFFVFVISIILFLSGCLSNRSNGSFSSQCQGKVGYTLCGYCSEDAMTSGNPNAGQCRYCKQGYTCSGDICGEITCKSGGDNTNAGGATSDGSSNNKQYCSTGYCYSKGYCCPGYAKYYCNGGCYDSVGANANGCYDLKATCY